MQIPVVSKQNYRKFSKNLVDRISTRIFRKTALEPDYLSDVLTRVIIELSQKAIEIGVPVEELLFHITQRGEYIEQRKVFNKAYEIIKEHAAFKIAPYLFSIAWKCIRTLAREHIDPTHIFYVGAGKIIKLRKDISNTSGLDREHVINLGEGFVCVMSEEHAMILILMGYPSILFESLKEFIHDLRKWDIF